MESELERHVRFFLHHLRMLPNEYQSVDSNRMTLAYFCVAALDLLGAIDQVDRGQIIEWIYRLQVVSSTPEFAAQAGFIGGGFVGGTEAGHTAASQYACGHVAMTYTALAMLTILGDDLSRVDRAATLHALRALQRPDGSFVPSATSDECDLRFSYCAAAICFMLDDWSGMDVEQAARFILSCGSYDGGFGMVPGNESHGGGMYCAVAALALMRRLESVPDLRALQQWCVMRVGRGFSGRPNKEPDTCYSFWVGAALRILGGSHLVDMAGVLQFHRECYHARSGGFGKVPHAPPDLLHSFYSVCAFSLAGVRHVEALDCELGISLRARSGMPLPLRVGVATTDE